MAEFWTDDDRLHCGVTLDREHPTVLGGSGGSGTTAVAGADSAAPFFAGTTAFNPDGSITQTSANGLRGTTTSGADGTITEATTGPAIRTKTTAVAAAGTITETVS